MAHGKETPRQKMIGMMYLVLTALLALQIQKEVMNSFINIDEGLNKSTQNTQLKNADDYANLNTQAALNPIKAGDKNKTAMEVKKRANELCRLIYECKKEIIKTADGPESKAILPDRIIVEDIQKKEDMTVGSVVMIGPEDKGMGKKLQEALESYRSFLFSIVEDKNSPEYKNAIEKMLNTDSRKTKAGINESWRQRNFEQIPVAAEVAILSSVETNVRNAESETIKYLLSSLSKTDFKFNTLMAIVIPNSNYVIKGTEYKAKILLAAYDSTKNPKIFIGDRIDSTYDDAQKTWKHSIANPVSVDVQNGVGEYKLRPGNVGNRVYKGVIEIQNPDGSTVTKSFRSEYQVAQGSYTVSPTKMNVFYLGVENPVKVMVSGTPSENVSADISNGSITRVAKTGSEWVVQPRRLGEAIISIKTKEGKKISEIGKETFRVKQIPNPVAKVGGRMQGVISKAELLAQAGLSAEIENFDFDLRFKVTSFKLVYFISGFTKEVEAKGNRFTTEQKAAMEQIQRNQRVYFEEIKAVGPDNIPRTLNSIILKIN